MSASIAPRLTRWRVPIGFVSAIAALALARPTAASLAAGAVVAVAGECLRIWAAGHLEKSREVTKSGPYRFTRHPLYVGSSIMGVGLAIAAHSWIVAGLVAVYLGATLTAAVRSEEAFLRERFGGEYEAYASGGATDGERTFSLARAMRNREYRAVAGLGVTMAILALRVAWGG